MRSATLMMKARTVLLLLAALLLGLSATAMAELPDPGDGFGDLKWGQTIAGQPGFLKIKAKGNAEFFIRNDDPFTLYGKPADRVIYGAKQGKLFAAYIHLEDPDSFQQLQADLSQHYGQPKRSSANKVNVIQWGKGDFTLKLKEYTETGLMKLGIYYDPLREDVNMSNLDMVMDTIYENDLESFWIKGPVTTN